jgi:P27 family predicted phage terminase small subunit
MSSPKHLTLPARRLFDGIHKLYDLEPHDDAVLVKALEAFDRAEQARTILATEGLTVTSRFGELKVHPLIAVERDSRAGFLAGMRQLGLDYEPTPAHKRTAAAREARWSA